MAGMIFRVCVTVALLLCLLESQTLLSAAATSGSEDPHTSPAVHCWCARYPNLTMCSWPQPAHFPPSHYIATYSERQSYADVKHCQPVKSHSSSSTQNLSSLSSDMLWFCHLPDLKLFTDYIVNVTAVYPHGSNSHLTSFMMEDIVKPDPPVDVRVSHHGIRSMLVEWSPPPTWNNLDIFPLKYWILYRWQNRGTQKQVTLGPFESTQIELKELVPGKTYTFQVCAKEMLGLGECSNWSSPARVTIPRPHLKKAPFF